MYKEQIRGAGGYRLCLTEAPRRSIVLQHSLKASVYGTHRRAHFSIPDDLLADIDKLAGKGKRTSLVLDILRKEVRQRRLLQILENDLPILKDEDHPELKTARTPGFAGWAIRTRSVTGRSWATGCLPRDDVSARRQHAY